MFRQMRYIIFLMWMLMSVCSFCQDVNTANRVIDDLCQDAFAGRGYIANGDQLAASYLAEKYKEMNLSGFTADYLQPFNFSVNTVKVSALSIDGTVLKPGYDYMVAPGSPSFSGEWPVFYVSPKMLSSSRLVSKVKKAVKKGYLPVLAHVDTKNTEVSKNIEQLRRCLSGQPIAFLKSRLTWGVSTRQSDYLELWINDAAFDPFAESINVRVESSYIPSYTSNNVIGYVEGATFPDSFLVLCGHYDHLGKMGEAIFYGANDNASGMAMMLDLAHHFTQNPMKYSILFIAFGGEEAGLLGSLHYVKHPLVPLSKTKFVFNMDLMGSGEDGATVVNGKVYKTYYDRLVRINEEQEYLPRLKSRGKASNSDHYFFSEAGVPSFFMYLMGKYKYYHTPEDNAENLELGEYYNRTFQLIRDFVVSLDN